MRLILIALVKWQATRLYKNRCSRFPFIKAILSQSQFSNNTQTMAISIPILFLFCAVLAVTSAKPLVFSEEDSYQVVSSDEADGDGDGLVKVKPRQARPMIRLDRLLQKKSAGAQLPQQQHQIKEKLEKMFSPDIFNMMVATMLEHQKQQQQQEQSPLSEIAALNDPELIKSKIAKLGYAPASSGGKNNDDMTHLFHRFG